MFKNDHLWVAVAQVVEQVVSLMSVVLSPWARHFAFHACMNCVIGVFIDWSCVQLSVWL